MSTRLAAAGLVALVPALCIGAIVGEPALDTIDTLPPAQFVVASPATTTPPDSLHAVGAVERVESGGAYTTRQAERQPAAQVTPTVPPPAPTPTPGDCESWRPLLDRYGIPYNEAVPIMRRESGCTMAHNYNRATRDDSWGPFQVNRWGSLGAWWDSGGFTADVMSTPAGAVAAAAVLYGSCRWSPWVKPYGCDGDYLQTPEPRWAP
jgi:hypothetical protein